jgi:RNA polymerase sigma factor (sigma-70 family)
LQREEECAAWMRQALEGDTAAYRQLLQALSGTLRASVRHRFVRAGSGNADVEDVVQDTLLAIHLKRHTWDPSERIGPWIAAIARNKLIDVLRRRGRHLQVPFEDLEDGLFAESSESEGSKADVAAILQQLSERQRAIVRLVSLEGCTCRQAGEHLQMSEGAVRVTLHRTLKALAALYRGEPT